MEKKIKINYFLNRKNQNECKRNFYKIIEKGINFKIKKIL